MQYKAIRASVGFMGRYWNEGDITPDIQDKELLNDPALVAHFKPKEQNANTNSKQEEYLSTITSQTSNLDKKTVAELKLIAAQNGIEIPQDAKKAEIIELLK